MSSSRHIRQAGTNNNNTIQMGVPVHPAHAASSRRSSSPHEQQPQPAAKRKPGRPGHDEDKLKLVLTAQYTGPDASTASKELTVEAVWGPTANVNTKAKFKTQLAKYRKWCDDHGHAYAAHPINRVCKDYLQATIRVSQHSPGGLLNAARDARDMLGKLRTCQPGVPESLPDASNPYAVTMHPDVIAIMAVAEQIGKAYAAMTAEVQQAAGVSVLKDREQQKVMAACRASRAPAGTLVGALVALGVSTGMRLDDLARRRWCELSVDTDSLMWGPLKATVPVFILRGGASKANNAQRAEHFAFLEHSNLDLCPAFAMAMLMVWDLNQPSKLVPTWLDDLAEGCKARDGLSFRRHFLFYDPKDPSSRTDAHMQGTGNLAADAAECHRQLEARKSRLSGMYAGILSSSACLANIMADKDKALSMLRPTAVKRLLAGSCDETAMKRFGRWLQAQGTGSTCDTYMGKDPLSALEANCILAGFGKPQDAAKSYYLGRATVEVPLEWVDAVTTITAIAADGTPARVPARTLLSQIKEQNAQLSNRAAWNRDGVSSLEAVLELARVFWHGMAVLHTDAGAAPQMPQMKAAVEDILDSQAFSAWAKRLQEAHAGRGTPPPPAAAPDATSSAIGPAAVPDAAAHMQAEAFDPSPAPQEARAGGHCARLAAPSTAEPDDSANQGTGGRRVW